MWPMRRRLQGILAIDYVTPDYYAQFPKPCMGGWAKDVVNISPEGKVLPCHAAESLPLSFDNIKDRPLREIWYDGEAFNRFRGYRWMKEPCSSCSRKEIDFGGCRCQAFAVTGDATNANPACSLSPHRHWLSDRAVRLRQTPSRRSSYTGASAKAEAMLSVVASRFNSIHKFPLLCLSPRAREGRQNLRREVFGRPFSPSAPACGCGSERCQHAKACWRGEGQDEGGLAWIATAAGATRDDECIDFAVLERRD